MPIHVILRSGRDILVAGDTLEQWNALEQAHGVLSVKDQDGLDAYLMKTEAAYIKPIPAAEFDKRKAEEDAKLDAQKAEREDMKARLKTNGDYEAAVRERDDLLKRLEQLEIVLGNLERQRNEAESLAASRTLKGLWRRVTGRGR